MLWKNVLGRFENLREKNNDGTKSGNKIQK